MRAHDVGLRADAEELRFRPRRDCARDRSARRKPRRAMPRGVRAGFAVDRRVLVSIGQPEIRRPSWSARARPISAGDTAAGDAVIDPELANARVRVGEREAVGGFRVGEEGGVEIETEIPALCPIDPALEMSDRDFVAIRARSGRRSPRSRRGDSRGVCRE